MVLQENNKLESIVVPDENRYSSLLKKFSTNDKDILFFLNRKKKKLIKINEKAAVGTKP